MKKMIKKMLAPIVNELVQAEMKSIEAGINQKLNQRLMQAGIDTPPCNSTEFKQNIVQSVLESLNRQLREASQLLV